MSCCYFFFFFYSYTVATIGTITTIISSNVSKGEGHRKQTRSFGGRKELGALKLVFLLHGI
jgi:hypothetical protein